MNIKTITRWATAFLELLYPKICPCCGGHISNQQATVCLSCTLLLPFTNFHLLQSNPLHKKFWGRIELCHVDSLLFMEKSSRSEALVYFLKYKQRPDIGEYLSDLTITRYLNHNIPMTIEAIVIVPLHPVKQKKRGYNQCYSFAKKLGRSWNIPFYPNALIRAKHSKSQTGNNRMERWQNVADAFQVVNSVLFFNKHILLIDDVLTTGATIEACGQQILKIEGTTLSVLTMACKV